MKMADEGNFSNVQMEQRNRIIHKLGKLPDDQLEKIEILINSLLSAEPGKKETRRFAGSWSDMSQEEFDSFLKENQKRRSQNRRDRFEI
jgi:hypothetical protein